MQGAVNNFYTGSLLVSSSNGLTLNSPILTITPAPVLITPPGFAGTTVGAGSTTISGGVLILTGPSSYNGGSIPITFSNITSSPPDGGVIITNPNPAPVSGTLLNGRIDPITLVSPIPIGSGLILVINGPAGTQLNFSIHLIPAQFTINFPTGVTIANVTNIAGADTSTISFSTSTDTLQMTAGTAGDSSDTSVFIPAGTYTLSHGDGTVTFALINSPTATT